MAKDSPAIIVDSSAIIEMIFPDMHAAYSQHLARTLRTSRAIVPQLFFYETANVLLMQVRRGKSTSAEMLLNLKYVKSLIQESVDIKDMAPVALLAQEYRLTAYDASYLAIAKWRNAPLATLDTALKKAALAEKLFYNPAA